MKRELTNFIRYVMDNLLPNFIRDNKLFMWPFFYYWFKGKNINQIMNFKNNVKNMTEEEYSDIYKTIEIRAKDRPTDLNEASIDYIIDHIDKNAKTLLDVGSGRGYFLNKLSEHTRLELTGCDMNENIPGLKANYSQGNIEKLPFPDKSFDVVTCTHTIEHILKEQVAIAELIRVTKKQLFIVTPCQKYFYYTLDFHVNFYPTEESLTSHIPIKDFECKDIQGDWVYTGTIKA